MTTVARRPGTAARRRELFEEASAILSIEFAPAPTLEQLARRLACSPRQVERAFSEAGEGGPRAFLRRVRMRRAAELLRQGWPVQETARLVGYSQPAEFTRPSVASTVTCRERSVVRT